MLIKRLLLLLPILIVVVLFQSYFWVPTFSDQTKGGDERLRQFITGSIGDAQILNPILHADTASGAIVDPDIRGSHRQGSRPLLPGPAGHLLENLRRSVLRTPPRGTGGESPGGAHRAGARRRRGRVA